MLKESQQITKKQMINRLKRAEGQLRGLERLINEEVDCEQILVQLSAVKAALEQLSIILITEKLKDCFSTNRLESVDALLRKFLKGVVK